MNASLPSLALLILPLQCALACGATVGNNSTSNMEPWVSGKITTGNGGVTTGGYWWTYTDHNAADSAYHATISQVTSLSVGFKPTVDSDPTHGNVLAVSGSVPPALPWALVSVQDPSTIDGYWQAAYPDSTIPAYPAAGIGFGLQHFNAPFDATGGGTWVGIA